MTFSTALAYLSTRLDASVDYLGRDSANGDVFAIVRHHDAEYDYVPVYSTVRLYYVGTYLYMEFVDSFVPFVSAFATFTLNTGAFR